MRDYRGADYKVAEWRGASLLSAVRDFRCGYCGREASASYGYEYGAARDPVVALCPHCASPTLLEVERRQIPGELPGGYVAYLPADVELLFLEARLAASAGAYTGSVLMCRKILAYIAVQKGAETGRSFSYVLDYLAEGHLPPSLGSWLEYLRAQQRGAPRDFRHEPAGRAGDDRASGGGFALYLRAAQPGAVPPRSGR